MRTQIWMMMTAFFILGCCSDADKMAEFCLNFETAVSGAQDCLEMSSRLTQVLDQSIVLYDTTLCNTTTACLPCRKGARRMLSECGTDPAMRPTLDSMYFSNSLRSSLPAPNPLGN